MRRWRADPPRAAAIGGRMGRNSIHREHNSDSLEGLDFLCGCVQNSVRCQPEVADCVSGQGRRILPPMVRRCFKMNRSRMISLAAATGGTGNDDPAGSHIVQAHGIGPFKVN